MENNNMTLVAIVLVVGLVVGGGIGYYAAPSGDGEGTITIEVPVAPLKDTTVQLGYVMSNSAGLETGVPFLEEIVTADLNDYADKLGYGVQFEILIDQADSQAAVHLEKVQSFKSMGISVFHGGPWSSMAQASLSYVNENDMLMISSSSTSPLLAIPDDRLYRTCPTDYVQAPAIAEMLESWGIEAIIIFQRADSWGDGIYNILESEWEDRGHVILERVRYAAEATEYSSYLQTINDIIAANAPEYGYERIAIQTMAFNEQVVFVSQTPDYPETRKVIWMGTESSGRSQRMLDDGGGMQVDLRIFSSLMAPSKSWKWDSLESRYMALTGQNAGFYTGTDYDAIFIDALSMLQVQSTEASDVVEIFPDVARGFWGSTGWVDLDENGDRKPGIFDIWGFYERDGELGFQKYGEYNGISIEVTWYDDVLAEQGITRLGPRN